jgi:UDP-glucose 4-epimerase
MPQSRHWLITGGCGFIGTALIRGIISSDSEAQIRVLDNLCVGTRTDLQQACDFEELTDHNSVSFASLDKTAKQVQLMVGDIRDFETCSQACQECHLAVHLAANTGVYPSVLDPFHDCQTNVLGTVNMLEACRQKHVQGLIFASSGAPVGEVDPPVHEELAPRPVSPYGASKLAGEGYCSAYCRTFGLKTAALRFGNVYGPGSSHKSSVVAKFIKQAIQGEPCVIYGDGTQTRDFIFIDDLIQAILKVAFFKSTDCQSKGTSELSDPFSDQGHSCSLQPESQSPGPKTSFSKEPWGEIFQIATNKEHTVNEMAQMLQFCLQEQGVDMQLCYGDPQPGDIKRNYSDTSKARHRLGWQCQVGLQQGLQRTVKWFLEGRRRQ